MPGGLQAAPERAGWLGSDARLAEARDAKGSVARTQLGGAKSRARAIAAGLEQGHRALETHLAPSEARSERVLQIAERVRRVTEDASRVIQPQQGAPQR